MGFPRKIMTTIAGGYYEYKFITWPDLLSFRLFILVACNTSYFVLLLDYSLFVYTFHGLVFYFIRIFLVSYNDVIPCIHH
jgi:hypothetical protein